MGGHIISPLILSSDLIFISKTTCMARTECLLHVGCEPGGLPVQRSAKQTRVWESGNVGWGGSASAERHKKERHCTKSSTIVAESLIWCRCDSVIPYSLWLLVSFHVWGKQDQQWMSAGACIYPSPWGNKVNPHHRPSFTFTLDLLGFDITDNAYVFRDEASVVSPESCAVKMNHHPLGRVEDKRVRKLDAPQGPAELRTDVGWASVRSVNVEPHALFCTCRKDSNTSNSTNAPRWKSTLFWHYWQR